MPLDRDAYTHPQNPDFTNSSTFTLNVQDIFEPLNRLIAVYSVYYPQYPALYQFFTVHIHSNSLLLPSHRI
jgi:hypothetical protein